MISFRVFHVNKQFRAFRCSAGGRVQVERETHLSIADNPGVGERLDVIEEVLEHVADFERVTNAGVVHSEVNRM